MLIPPTVGMLPLCFFRIPGISINLSFKALCKEIGINHLNSEKNIMIGGPIEITRGFVIHSYENDNSYSHKINQFRSFLNTSKKISPNIWYDSDDELVSQNIIKNEGPFIAVSPYSNWKEKDWSIEKYLKGSPIDKKWIFGI